jgi:hypothetical protein
VTIRDFPFRVKLILVSITQRAKIVVIRRGNMNRTSKPSTQLLPHPPMAVITRCGW